MPSNSIIEALKQRDFTTALRLIDTGVSVDEFDDGPEMMGVKPDGRSYVDRTGRTPLIAAAEVGSFECVKALLERGVRVDFKEQTTCPPRKRTALSYAAAAGHLEIVRELLHHRADPNAKAENMRDERPGMTPLHYAAAEGHLAAVKLLLSHGANPNAKTRCGCTPAILAMENGHAGTVELLAQSGADLTLAAKDGWDVLLAAIDRPESDHAFVFTLLQRGVPVDGHPGEHNSPLMAAITAHSLPLVSRLLDLGADVNKQTHDGFTALMYAVLYRRWDTCELLLQRGAESELKNRDGESAFDIAAKRGDTDAFRAVAERFSSHASASP